MRWVFLRSKGLDLDWRNGLADRKLRVGIIGFGSMGRIRALEILNDSDYELVGAFDPDKSKIISWHSQVRVYSSPVELIADNLDGIFVCSIVSASPFHIKEALAHGVKVFCEKPPAKTSSLLEFILEVDRANIAALPVMVGFNHRFHGSVNEAHKLLSDESLGRLLFVEAVYGKGGSIDFGKNWRNTRDLSGGGILLDQGIHMLDLLLYLTKDEYRVEWASVRTCHWDIETEDLVTANLNGGQYSVNFVSSAVFWKHEFRLSMHFDNGFISLEGLATGSNSYAPEQIKIGIKDSKFSEDRMGRPVETIKTYVRDYSWNYELIAFKEFLISGKNTHANLADATRVLDLVSDIYEKGTKNESRK